MPESAMPWAISSDEMGLSAPRDLSISLPDLAAARVLALSAGFAVGAACPWEINAASIAAAANTMKLDERIEILNGTTGTAC